MVSSLFSTLLFASMAVADLVRVGNPECFDVRVRRQCLPRSLATAPAIGIYLAAEYGTVSVAYPNGTTVDIAQVPSSPDIRDYFAELAADEGCVHPSLLTRKERLALRWDAIKRRMNKLRGLPSSLESLVLADYIGALRLKAEAYLQKPIQHAYVVLPPSPGLLYDHLEDAAEYIGLDLLQGYTSYDTISTSRFSVPHPLVSTLTTATWVGRSLGLCRNHTSHEECRREQASIQTAPGRGFIRISLNEQTLGLDGGRCASATHCVGDFSRDLHDMGFHGETRRYAPTRYWATMRDLIVEVGRYAGGAGIDELILTGTHVREPEFLRCLEQALALVDDREGVPSIGEKFRDALRTGEVGYDTVFLPGRGAAEMAKRVQAGQRWYAEDEQCNGEVEEGVKRIGRVSFEGIRVQQ